MPGNNLPRTKSSRLRNRQRGSVTVEFMLIAPFLIWITFAIIEYGVALNCMNTLNQLARDGGRYAAIHAGDAKAYMSGSVAGSIRNFIENESTKSSLPITVAMESNTPPAIEFGTVNTSTGAFTTGTPTTPGGQVAVQVNYDLSTKLFGAGLVPGISKFAQTKSKRAVFIIEQPSST